MRHKLGRRPTLAVVGATGAVGRVLLDVLPTRSDFWGALRLSAADEDVGSVLRVGGSSYAVQALTEDFFADVDIALFDLPPALTPTWVEIATAQGALVVDNSTAFRMDPQVPLVVPEVNAAAIHHRPKGVVASPGATVMTMIDVLATLHAGWQLEELVVTTFQAASGLGRRGMNRLYDEIGVVAKDRSLGQRTGDVRRAIEGELGAGPFPGPLALNIVPMCGAALEDGWTTEEEKVRSETRKILGIPELKVVATCVRVPVISSHSMNVHARFARRITVERARQALVETPMVVGLDDLEHDEFPTPCDVVGADPRFVGRIRQAQDLPNSIDLFVSGDNLRKGAALNMLQTAELLSGAPSDHD